MNNQKYRTGSLIILIIVSGGYHGYYIPTGELGYWWLILFVTGMIAFITFYVRESTHRKGNSLRNDVLCLLFSFVFPLWKLPYGLSILIMLIVSGIYITYIHLNEPYT